jgi:uncharacterized surface protein with fasciclin (FAS1) repeats
LDVAETRDETRGNIHMNKLISAAVVGVLLAAAPATFANAQMAGHDNMKGGMMKEKTVTVGGAPMYPSKNIVQNAVNSKDHTTLVAAVKAAGLVDTLSSPGPFTVFAPTNAAFGKLPAGTVDTLVKPENKGTLTKILTYHVVPGRLSSADLMAKAKMGAGKNTLTTAEGETLTIKSQAGAIWIVDAKGGMSKVTIPNVNQSNGVIHVVDTVLMP